MWFPRLIQLRDVLALVRLTELPMCCEIKCALELQSSGDLKNTRGLILLLLILIVWTGVCLLCWTLSSVCTFMPLQQSFCLSPWGGGSPCPVLSGHFSCSRVPLFLKPWTEKVDHSREGLCAKDWVLLSLVGRVGLVEKLWVSSVQTGWCLVGQRSGLHTLQEESFC